MTDAWLFTGGRIFTGTRYASSLLVADGRVVAVGEDGELRHRTPTGTQRRELAGRLVVPGLVDAHLHLSELARHRAGLDVGNARSADELLALLAEWASRHPGRPVVGRGWAPERWPDPRPPSVADLDRAVPDRPAVVYHVSGHAARVNSLGLRAAGIDPDLAAQDDPTVGRRPDGRPDGALAETALHPLGALAQEATPVGTEELAATTLSLLAAGITSVGTVAASPQEVEGLAAIAASGRLPLTVRAYARLRDRRSVRRTDPPLGRFAVVGVKGFLDGAFGPRTAWLSEPYDDAPDLSGLPVGEESDLGDEVAEAAELGLAPALHAIGDRAVARAARILAPVIGRTEAPARIEHAGLTPPSVLAALRRSRPTLVVQPGFVWSDVWLPERLGARRARWAYLFRTLCSAGVPVAASSDAPFDALDPWRALRAAVERADPEGRSANPDPGEALPAEEALAMYTANAAAACGLADRGTLEAGAAADLVVLNVPDLSLALRGPPAPVEETWVDGRPVYPRSALSGA